MFGTKRNVLLATVIVVLSAGLITTAVTLATHPRTVPVTVPEETTIHVTLDQGISSNQNRPGDTSGRWGTRRTLWPSGRSGSMKAAGRS